MPAARSPRRPPVDTKRGPAAEQALGLFRSTSWSICLSRLRSATSCFSFLFSSSRTLSRLTSATPIPRNFFSQLLGRQQAALRLQQGLRPGRGQEAPTLEPDPATSPIVERIFEMSEAGKGMLDITRTLNDEGIASPAGKVWGKTSVHKVLTNEAYTGTFTLRFRLVS